jgi:hypothetical protein
MATGIGPHRAGQDQEVPMSDSTLITGDQLAELPNGIDDELRDRAAAIRWRLNDLIPEFQVPAYDYILKTDELPTYDQLPPGEPVCRVKLFHPFSRWTYYAVAVTDYDGIGPVLSGFCVSPIGPDCDEFGDQGLAEIAGLRVHGLPPERDLHFEPRPLDGVRAGLR